VRPTELFKIMAEVFSVRVDCIVRALLLPCTVIPYIIGGLYMDTVSVNKFRDNLKNFVEHENKKLFMFFKIPAS